MGLNQAETVQVRQFPGEMTPFHCPAFIQFTRLVFPLRTSRWQQRTAVSSGGSQSSSQCHQCDSILLGPSPLSLQLLCRLVPCLIFLLWLVFLPGVRLSAVILAVLFYSSPFPTCFDGLPCLVCFACVLLSFILLNM